MIEERKAVFVGVLYAAIEGNVDFVVEVSKAYPLIVLSADDEGWNIFFHAVAYRQAEVFNLIHGLPFKDKMLSHIDANGNTMLHVVAKMDHPSKLNRISGPAFQMQSELQWFKEVEKIVPQGFRVYQNLDNMKPEDVFKENHRELRKDGEEWMKETASNCSIVAALVVTIMFAAAFTVPGGNDQNFGFNSRVVYLPIIMLASVPVILFVFLQFPLLVRMISSTYGRGIFKRNVKPWLLK
ncbi:ankyrin repeat-containing protein NPR4-like isoform X1 [Senna tora]|uniref:Ankyrin repeat-containing protein NPR4-like isoform X1 n=1 Tax=Senna tora TaxID=362788 RepID=A0A834WH28_9FABA|nr:ankyrin repeat-containing protein NPR4-like isoform X1 [Senna tora]